MSITTQPTCLNVLSDENAREDMNTPPLTLGVALNFLNRGRIVV